MQTRYLIHHVSSLGRVMENTLKIIFQYLRMCRNCIIDTVSCFKNEGHHLPKKILSYKPKEKWDVGHPACC